MSGPAWSKAPQNNKDSFTYVYETPSNKADLREMADDFELLGLDMADGVRDLEIELTASQFNETLDEVKDSLHSHEHEKIDKLKDLKRAALKWSLTATEESLVDSYFSDPLERARIKTPPPSRDDKRAIKDLFKNKIDQVEQKYENLRQRKEQLYTRLKEVFFPLESWGMQTVLRYVLIDTTPPAGTGWGAPTWTSVPTYTYDENEFIGEQDAEWKILSMEVCVQRPTDKKKAKKMKDLLEDRMDDYLKLAQHVRDAAWASAVIQWAECAADMYAQMLLAFEMWDEICTAVSANPGGMCNFPPHTASWSLSANATVDCTWWLLAWELFDGWDQGQKYRFRKVATIATLAVTIYGIVKAIKWDANWRSFLSVVGLAGVASYIWKGKFKLPHQMVDEGLRGWDTYSWMCELMGIEEKYQTPSPVAGMEWLVVQADGMHQLMTGLSSKILHDEKLIEIKWWKIYLTEHPQWWSMLASYLHNYYPNSWRAEAANSYFAEQKAGKNPFDDALGILGIRDEIISKPQSTTTFDTYAQAFRYRKDVWVKFMEDNDLELKPEFYHSIEVEQYLCAKTWRTLDDLVSQWVFKKQDNLPGYIPSFATLPVVDALTALPELQDMFDDIPTADFAAAVQFGQASTQLSLRWQDLYALPGALWTDLKNYELTPEEETRIEYLLTQFFSQVMWFSYGKLASEALDPAVVWGTMKEAFEHHKIFLDNYKALGDFANAWYLRPNMDQDPVMIAVLLTDFSDPATRTKLATDHPTVFTSPITSRTDAFAVLVSSGSLEYNVGWFPLLEGINLNDSDVLAAEASLTWPSTLSSQEKKQLALWKVGYDRRLQNKLPTQIWILATWGKSIEWTAYGQIAKIDFTSPWSVIVGGIQILTDDGVPRTMDELIQIAHLATMMVGTFQYMAKTWAPWEEDNGRLDFKYNNSLTDSLADLWSNLWDISQARKALYRNIDTTVLSEEWMRQFFPVLMKGKLLESFCTDMNKLPVWHAESFNNVDHFRKRAQIVKKVIERKNRWLPAGSQIKIVMDTTVSTKIDFKGPVMKMYMESGWVREEIELDVLNNQVMNYWLATIPDLEMATDIAITLLKTKLAIAAATEAVKNSFISLPTWMISIIGQDNWEDLKSAWAWTAEQLKDILKGIGWLAWTMLQASKDFLLAILKVAALPSYLVSVLTWWVTDWAAEDLVKNKLVNDGIVAHNTWQWWFMGVVPRNADSIISDRSRLSWSSYSVTDIQLMLDFDDRSDETKETLQVLQKAKKHNLVRDKILEFSTGKPLFATGWAELIANSPNISEQHIFELANLMSYTGNDDFRKDLETLAEAKDDMRLLVRKIEQHAPTGIVAGTRPALTAGEAAHITWAAIALPTGETYVASSVFIPPVAPLPSVNARAWTLDIEFTVNTWWWSSPSTVLVRHKIHFSD